MRRLFLTAALLLAASAARADKVVTHNFVSATAAPKLRSLVVDIPAGGLRVLNGKAGEIRVSGIVRRDYDGWNRRSENQKIVDDIDVEAYVKGDTAIVRRRFGPNASSWRSQKFSNVQVTIEVPAGVAVSFETSFGEVSMEGSFGDIDVDLRAGEVRVDTPRSDVRVLNASCRVGEVYTNLGNEIVTREGLFPGRTHFENPAGRTLVNVHVTAGEVHVSLK